MKFVSPLNTNQLYITKTPIDYYYPSKIRELINKRYFHGLKSIDGGVHIVYRLDAGIKSFARKELLDLAVDIKEYV